VIDKEDEPKEYRYAWSECIPKVDSVMENMKHYQILDQVELTKILTGYLELGFTFSGKFESFTTGKCFRKPDVDNTQTSNLPDYDYIYKNFESIRYRDVNDRIAEQQFEGELLTMLCISRWSGVITLSLEGVSTTFVVLFDENHNIIGWHKSESNLMSPKLVNRFSPDLTALKIQVNKLLESHTYIHCFQYVTANHTTKTARRKKNHRK
jgi:hypothetical protein